ncbi:GNAT family N-acetyltransferase|uniref:GNAT family N-acetyltransferase n=1 Tax=Noviherbaspirillum sp. L7-7A TaxID=2850560 RepID=UPI001C2C80A8|nr:GNAT family N-acetyltransferase [Noviherbaspirillum sp. L7-7A]MBV0878854.1 GNAT family N-acetyltransferase [Noviherbaspirillum sp. L7-7A]
MDNKISMRVGVPDILFMREAWSDETLSVKLPGIDFTVAFPPPDPAMSLVATLGDRVIGQCAAQTAAEYWQHVERLGERGCNASMQAVGKIHARVVAAEMRFLSDRGEVSEETMRSAGIAVIPSFRGQGIGKAMRARQIEIARDNDLTGLFSETTNQYAAGTITPFAPELVAEFPYKDLARELNEPRLADINDSFTVWYKKV